MTAKYDNPCRECNSGEKDDGSACRTCDGYGYLMTFEGHALIEFLKRRGYGEPMSPRAEEELRGMME